MPKITDNTFIAELGRLIQRRRESVGMSRETLADMIGSKYEVVRLYEEGQRVMKMDRFFEILTVLGVSIPDSLFAILGGTSAHMLSLVARMNMLDEASRRRLMRQIDALIEVEKSDP